MKSMMVMASMVVLTGCGLFEASKPTILEVAKAAAPYLQALAEQHAMAIDEDKTLCFPVDPVDGEIGDKVVLMCVAPAVDAGE